MNQKNKQIKLWQGILVLVSAAIILFIAAPAFLAPFGMYGTLIGEWLMLAVALLLATVMGNSPKELFPLKKPTLSGSFGAVLMWVGAFLVEITLVLILYIFFPEAIWNVNSGLSESMLTIPFLSAFFIIAVTPAICEEAVFRGIFLKSLNPEKYKWPAILVCGAIFGLFHGDVFRFVPTAIGGAVMAYMLVESKNMFYNCLFHFINNLLPLVLLYGMKDIYESMGVWSNYGYQDNHMMVLSAGIYMMLSAAAPSCLYIGNYLLHSNTPGYRKKLFPSNSPGTVITLIAVSGGIFIVGAALMVFGLVTTIMPLI